MTAKLKSQFGDCLHVDAIGLTVPAKDIDLWNHALHNELVIVTNDEDFLNFSNLKGFPPKVVLLRTGNQSNLYIEQLLLKHKADIQELFESDIYGVLELF